MTDLPRLTDSVALAAHRKRAANSPDSVFFLHERVVGEVRLRLRDLEHRPACTAVVTGIRSFWREAFPDADVVPDAEIIAFPNRNYDFILHAMALHWATDPIGQLAQCRLALRPGGLFMSASFGGLTLQELRQAITQAEIGITGGLSPRILPMGEVTDLGNLLFRAGLAEQVSDVLTLEVSYYSAFDLMRDLRAMGETNALEARKRSCAPRRLFLETARIYADRFGKEDGRVSATFQIVFLTARSPGTRPAKPRRSVPMRLRPGFRFA